MKAALLPDRGVVKVAGGEARTFLNGLLTADIADVSPQRARFAALLTPQGKIIADFIVADDNGALLLDCPREVSTTLADRLKFYRLRAKVTVEDLSAALTVMAFWDGTAPLGGISYTDPRLPALGQRAIVDPSQAPQVAAQAGAELVSADAYETHRIALGVPRGGLDFAYGDAFPHEADMDQLNGVDFDKGCYVGQEVVSRVQHRGTARSRIIPVSAAGGAVPQAGTLVMAGDKQIGQIGSAAGGRGLAMLRLDRLADAEAAGVPLVAGGVTLLAHKPDWAHFAVPGEKANPKANP
jgi:folate-binding protein YgfZ